jgi:hypothetical protein
MWQGAGDSRLDGLWKRFVYMVAFTIALVYCLVVADLYEVLSFSCCAGLLVLRRLWLDPERKTSAEHLNIRLAVPLYDTLDGLAPAKERISGWSRQQISRLAAMCGSLANDAGHLVLLVAVLVYSAYLRYYDPLVHAAPAMSDAYVTLAWLKYVEQQALFHDGIYPQGFHIILSTLHKFAGQDALFTLKYAGPLTGVLTVCGIYFAVARFTGRRSAGLAAALVYGCLGAWLPADWSRQAATNSQEFALVFLAPAWYWSHKYLNGGKRSDWWAACCSFLIIGWVHTLVYAFLLVGLCCLGIAHLLGQWRTAIRRAWPLIQATLFSGVAMLLPLGIGLLLGKDFHQSSLEFINARVATSYPPVTWLDVVAMAGILLCPLLAIAKRHRQRLVSFLFIALLGSSAFAIYEFLGPLTGNAVLVTRSNLLWALMVALGCGLAWNFIWTLVTWLLRVKWADLLGVAAALSLVFWQIQPLPAMPYKMQTDAMVEQYLRIAGSVRPTEWMIIGPSEFYDLALGNGLHMEMTDLLRDYDPGRPGLLKTFAGEDLLTPDIFIYLEEHVFETSFSNLQAEYQRRKQEYPEIKQWLTTFAEYHANLSLYYQDADLQVWHIDQRQLLSEARIVLWNR